MNKQCQVFYASSENGQDCKTKTEGRGGGGLIQKKMSKRFHRAAPKSQRRQALWHIYVFLHWYAHRRS
jgi:hypothetical protein